MLSIVLLGPPGAGKGTIAVGLAERFDIPHISTGDMFRAAIAAGTQLGKTAKEIIDAGNLVPDDITVAIVKERLSQPDCDGGYLLDGFPRTLRQAEALEEIGVQIGKPLSAVLDLDCPDEVLLERIAGRRVCPTCGSSYHLKHAECMPKAEGVCDRCGSALIQRKDDNPESMGVRLVNYHKSTEPLIRFYEGKGLLRRFDASGDKEELNKAVCGLLEGLK